MQAATSTTAPNPGHILVGHQADRVLVHLERPVDFLNVSGAQALAMAYQLVSAARAAGAVAPAQRVLF
jgi:hypothetical protein